MKDKQIYEIEHCNDCPFMQNDYDDWAVGNDTIISCNLKYCFTKKFSVIYSFKRYLKEDEYQIERPNWCPLNDNQLTFKIKE